MTWWIPKKQPIGIIIRPKARHPTILPFSVVALSFCRIPWRNDREAVKARAWNNWGGPENVAENPRAKLKLVEAYIDD